MDVKAQGPGAIAGIVVVNIIWWMVLLAAIGLGAIHMRSCPVQPNIPIYLIVLGATSIVSVSLTYTCGAYNDGAICILMWACTTFLHIFELGWFIAGSTWVYSVYPPEYSPGTSRYCHQITYQFAFVVTTVLWVVMSLIFICGCCFVLLTCCKTIEAARHLIPDRRSFYGATSDFERPPAGDV